MAIADTGEECLGIMALMISDCAMIVDEVSGK